MKRITFPATCNICGKEGDLDAADLTAPWTTGVTHVNPMVCRDNLRQEAKRLRQLEQRVEGQSEK